MKTSVMAIAALLAFACEADAADQLGDPAQSTDEGALRGLIERSAGRDTRQDLIVHGLYSVGYPSVGVLIKKSKSGEKQNICSGTLIGCSTFITAAHCFDAEEYPYEFDPFARYTVFFSHAGFRDGTPVKHEAYKGPNADIGIVKLSSPVDRIQPSLLYSKFIEPGTRATIVGFGRTSEKVRDAGLKRYGAINSKSCTPSLDEEQLNDKNSVCWSFDAPLGQPGTNSGGCKGDSGGPLFITVGGHLELAGIIHGARDVPRDKDKDICEPNAYQVATRVSTYLKWVEKTASGDIGSRPCGWGSNVGSPGAEYRILSSDKITPRVGITPNDSDQYPIEVKLEENVKEIRFGLNGTGQNINEFSLDISSLDISSADSIKSCQTLFQFSFCSIKSATPGKALAGNWNIKVKIGKPEDDKETARGSYQLVFTKL